MTNIFIDTLIVNFGEINYGEIIKIGFDFPKIFISCIKHDYGVDSEKRNKLLGKYIQILKKKMNIIFF